MCCVTTRSIWKGLVVQMDCNMLPWLAGTTAHWARSTASFTRRAAAIVTTRAPAEALAELQPPPGLHGLA